MTHFMYFREMINHAKSMTFIVYKNTRGITSSCNQWQRLRICTWPKRFYSTDTSPDKSMDISTLKPFPEWRNVAAGPVWEKGFYKRVWIPYKESKLKQEDIISHETDWEEYVKKYEFSPVDYLETTDYKELYQMNLVWANYVRNKKGGIQRQKTRKTCVRKGVMSTGSPCPICRDEKLLLVYNNIPLINQFIDKETGKVHSELRTGLCQVKQNLLLQCVEMAKQYGYLPRKVHFVHCNVDGT